MTQTSVDIALVGRCVNAKPNVDKYLQGHWMPLTTGTNIFFGTDGGDDVFTATSTTLNAGDAIADGSSTDNDTLNVNVASGTAALTATTHGASVVGIENVNLNFTSFAEATADIASYKGTVTVNQAQAGGSTNATLTNAGGQTVAAGTGISGTFTVTQTAASSLTVNGGNAATVAHTNATTGSVNIVGGAVTTAATGEATTGSVTISGAALTSAGTTGKTGNITLTVAGTTTTATTATVVGTTGSTDVANVSAVGVVTLTNNANVETLNLSGNGAAVIYTAGAQPTAAAHAINLTGSQNVTLKMTTAIATGANVNDSSTGTSLVQITDGGAIDITDIVADAIRFDAITAGADITATSGQVIKIASDADRADFVSDATAGSTGEAISIEALGASMTIGNGTGGAGSGTDGFSTFNISANTAANTLIATVGTAATLNLSGSKAISLDAASTALSLDASGMTGKLTVNIDGTDDIATIVGGSGSQDTIVADTDNTDLSGVTFSDIEVLAIDAADAGDDVNVIVAGSQVSGLTLVVSGTQGAAATDEDVLTIKLDNAGVDASTLVIDTANVDIVFDLADVGATATSITGSSAVDSLSNQGAGKITFNGLGGADIITGGTGADTLTGGEGADTITGAAGNDTIVLTETTSAVDTVVFSATNGKDTVTGFTVGKDILDFNNVVSTGTEAVTEITNSSRTSGAVDTTNDTVYVIDDVSTNLGSTSNTTNVITDFTNLNQVATFLADGFIATASNVDVAVFILNNAGTAYVYYFADLVGDTGTAIEAGELTLTGVITASAAITTTEITV